MTAPPKPEPMRILYVGESWLGSCARSLAEALERRDDVRIVRVEEEAWFPRAGARWRRALARLATPARMARFETNLVAKLRELRPSVFMAFKGTPVRASLLTRISELGILTANVYPDCSPHAHGAAHRQAVGAYDLVISTKDFHPPLWRSVYRYENRCVHVPQGYDPDLHLASLPASRHDYDVVMVATYRPEYGRLLSNLAGELDDTRLRIAIGGSGWERARADLPGRWAFPGPVVGRDYISLLRRGRICIAPVSRDVIVAGERQPGDVESTRTYELAAAHCFFIHRRTDRVAMLYGHENVALFDDAVELAELIRHYLARPDERARMAAIAHARAVPAFSLDVRAGQIRDVLAGVLDGRLQPVIREPASRVHASAVDASDADVSLGR